jgi:GTP-binding protein
MKNIYHQANFLLSCPSLKGCPPDKGYEIVFAGRSNAGKSSAINALTLQKKLAKVSRTPGRTQHLVFFELDKERKLVDLPGYGYAKVPEHIKHKWHKDMAEYFDRRESLKAAILVMDIRHPLKTFDLMMLDWCSNAGIPVHILLTKSDKVKRGAASNSLLKVTREVDKYKDVTVQNFSSLKKEGLDILWAQLNIFFNIKQ